ncbi:conjugal transfer protein TraD [Candidatus Finniella inopinata]|uniref:Uncharacterized protein n=1 Tax=Candidatus Finniella inopinata TaxID=1696036 RepID=A0A4Q7DFJ1_9PROT|nr:conjugal transfer protein TraD [Candidatus Finniella inopinata]RZI45483.1 hypothetical protein EQU50_06985 [Candidatus Finniella inopinata]
MEKNARTRTLIQLGGLLVKSGLVDYVGIPIEVDLENSPEHKDKAYELLKILDRSLKRETRITSLKKGT